MPKKKHFCIFDELYSGTNHYEAIGTAYSYLKYISENKNVRFMLTTHFIQLCSLFDKERNISNMKMETKIVDNSPHYSYKMIKGVSKIKGGHMCFKATPISSPNFEFNKKNDTCIISSFDYFIINVINYK